MKTLPKFIQNIFYQTLQEKITLKAFETWVYTHLDELEHCLNSEDYLALISLNIEKKGANYELWDILKRQIDVGDFEKHRLLDLLQEALLKNKNLPFILMEMYHLYCKGYHFLQELGTNYGLSVLTAQVKNATAHTWEELTETQQQSLLDSFSYDALHREIQQIIEWLKTETIVLLGIKNESGHWIYKDFRNNQQP